MLPLTSSALLPFYRESIAAQLQVSSVTSSCRTLQSILESPNLLLYKSSPFPLSWSSHDMLSPCQKGAKLLIGCVSKSMKIFLVVALAKETVHQMFSSSPKTACCIEPPCALFFRLRNLQVKYMFQELGYYKCFHVLLFYTPTSY